MTRAAPGDGEPRARSSRQRAVKPEKSGSIKGIPPAPPRRLFVLGPFAAVRRATRSCPVDSRRSLVPDRRGRPGSVDPNYVSFVVDPASSRSSRRPTIPALHDFTSPALKALVKELAPALFVIAGGNSNCIRMPTASTCLPPKSADNYLSTYCEGKTYYGNLEPALFKTLLDFAADTGTDCLAPEHSPL